MGSFVPASELGAESRYSRTSPSDSTVLWNCRLEVDGLSHGSADARDSWNHMLLKHSNKWLKVKVSSYQSSCKSYPYELFHLALAKSEALD